MISRSSTSGIASARERPPGPWANVICFSVSQRAVAVAVAFLVSLLVLTSHHTSHRENRIRTAQPASQRCVAMCAESERSAYFLCAAYFVRANPDLHQQNAAAAARSPLTKPAVSSASARAAARDRSHKRAISSRSTADTFNLTVGFMRGGAWGWCDSAPYSRKTWLMVYTRCVFFHI